MKKLLLFVILLTNMCHVSAGNFIDGLNLKVRLGYNIGGTAPIGIPASIRSVDNFRLTSSFMAGVDLAMPFEEKWGLETGLRFENKGMDGDVTTKGYHMELRKGSEQIEGLFTGQVSQKVTQWMLTLPLNVTYKIGNKVNLKAGPYVSLLLNKDFSGIASNGYLREKDPTGPKIIIGNKEGEWATYDFTDDMRNFQVGVGVGLDWYWSKSLGVSAELNWGLTGVFKSDFKTVEQTLYPLYGCVSVFYKIN